MNYFWENGATNSLIENEQALSYAYQELHHAADNSVAQIGAGSKCLIAILCGNTLGALAGYLACLRGGHAALMLNPSLNAELRQAIIEQYAPHYLWQPTEGEPSAPLCTSYNYGLWPLAQQEGTSSIHPDLAVLLPTSGSTGSPKQVRISYKNLQSNAASIAEYLKLSPEDKPLTTLPMYYSYGLSIINSHLLVGAGMVLTNHTIMQKPFWDLLETRGITSIAGVPYTYEMLDRLRFFNRELPTLRQLTQAGGRLAPALVEKFAVWAKEQKKEFIVMYGQTEATARMAYLPAHLACDKPSSIGIAIPGGQFELRDTAGQPIEQAQVAGELIYRGANVTMGYAECAADLALGDLNLGVLATGDLALRDEEGCYYITGRLKRFIKLAGNRFGLDEADAIFRANGCETVCGGEDNLLKIATLYQEQVEDIKRLASSAFHLHSSQYKIIVVPSIPRNDSGKILYAQLFS